MVDRRSGTFVSSPATLSCDMEIDTIYMGLLFKEFRLREKSGDNSAVAEPHPPARSANYLWREWEFDISYFISIHYSYLNMCYPTDLFRWAFYIFISHPDSTFVFHKIIIAVTILLDLCTMLFVGRFTLIFLILSSFCISHRQWVINCVGF